MALGREVTFDMDFWAVGLSTVKNELGLSSLPSLRLMASPTKR